MIISKLTEVQLYLLVGGTIPIDELGGEGSTIDVIVDEF